MASSTLRGFSLSTIPPLSSAHLASQFSEPQSPARWILSRPKSLLRLHSTRSRTTMGVYAAVSVNFERSEESSTTAHKHEVHDVVIVGGGIAGFATALALHRLGVKSTVIEQSEDLRVAGSAIGLWSNAWRALEALGVADSLRNQSLRISGMELLGTDGTLIKSHNIIEGSTDIELRSFERKTLVGALCKPIPDNQVIYGSRVIHIKQLEAGYTEVECEGGQKMQTKVLIGCDGIGSVVAKWMKMKEPCYNGHVAIRGIAEYPDGHGLGDRVKQILGIGVRAGVAPMNANKVYWFVIFNSSGEKLKDANLVRKEALDYAKEWPAIITEAIQRTPLESFSRRSLSDRWMWPIGGPPLYKGGVTLAGDAMHPMTPNLGQGACCALEDAIILSRSLSKALLINDLSSRSPAQEMKEIELALHSYVEERWRRMLPLAIRSNLTGRMLQSNNRLVCSFRDMISRYTTVDKFLNHTNFDCGTLVERIK
ncbi:hypothetical protein KP509_09G055300 [Ceratopteris richardii]|uniref:FAD-binding domain-containing protein n=1 Tax=Ceratopteris richardii TaxID=49495 RepID=A0A8T2U6Z4_CERRI|nr:hypothetical protein KP509_09G055300 [Ceratopteris richardii]